jgi:pimeloyl-ACP methyl ester carboxylesterase
MNKLIAGGLLLAASAFAPAAQAQTAKPTVVLVHGAFADASSWNGVIGILEHDGYTVIAAANPLRGLRADADAVGGIVRSIEGPVVLVGHSYGGSVISEAAEGAPNVKALVYVAAFAPDAGESALGLTGKFPGSTLAPTLAPPVKLASGGNDLYILQARFHDQFAADVPAAEAQLMAAGQRPVTDTALAEPATAPAWRHIPSWFI